MARTVFALTADGQTTSYPDEANWGSEGGSSLSKNRYSTLGNTAIQYPSNNEGFNTPIVNFTMLNAYGAKVPAPKIRLMLPPQFNVNNMSNYQKGEGIFGAGGTQGKEIYDNIVTGAFGEAQGKGGAEFNPEAYAFSAAEALKYALQKGGASALGFAGSLGMSNLSQYEFTERQAVNPMSQMLYKGPEFRRYQLPFVMKPKNLEESQNVKRAISAFRLAASPSVPDTSGTGQVIGEGNAFTFGYPHLVQFDIAFFTDATNSKRIFKSKPCVIEQVAADYGNQKIAFFEDGTPTETTLTIQLIEIAPRTLGDTLTDANNPNITMK
jgi:hypothetical protein